MNFNKNFFKKKSLFKLKNNKCKILFINFK